MEGEIKSFLEDTDSQYQELRTTKDLKGLISNNQTGALFESELNKALVTIIHNLEKYLDENCFAGRFHPTGSTFIESDTPKNLDYDFLFVHSGIQNFKLETFEKEYPDLFSGVSTCDPNLLYGKFKKYIRVAIRQLDLGELKFAGYGNPDYNGLRCNGPALTCLLQHPSTGDKVITLDLTLGLPAPKEIQAHTIQRLEASPAWGIHIQCLPDEDKVIHIVPTYKPEKKEFLWLLSTAVLETKILSGLKITETIRAIKVLGNFVSLKSLSQRYFHQIELPEKAVEVYAKVRGRLAKKPEDRIELGFSLFHDHVFLLENIEEEYTEKTKQIISISGAAVKFFVLCELRDGNCTPGDEISWTTVYRFFSSIVEELYTALTGIPQELEKLSERETPLSRPYVRHPFLSSEVKRLNFANYAVVSKEQVLIFVKEFRDRCQLLIQKVPENEERYGGKAYSKAFYSMAARSSHPADDKGEERNETDRLYQTLDRYFYIPGYSADEVKFPSTLSDECSSSESEEENQEPRIQKTDNLYEIVDKYFYIPGYSADVVDFPSTSPSKQFVIMKCQKLIQSLENEITLTDWVDENLSAAWRQDAEVVRAVIESVCEKTIKSQSPSGYKVNSKQLRSFLGALNCLYGVPESLQLQALNSVYDHVKTMKHPENILKEVLNTLWSDGYISREVMQSWSRNMEQMSAVKFQETPEGSKKGLGEQLQERMRARQEVREWMKDTTQLGYDWYNSPHYQRVALHALCQLAVTWLGDMCTVDKHLLFHYIPQLFCHTRDGLQLLYAVQCVLHHLQNPPGLAVAVLLAVLNINRQQRTNVSAIIQPETEEKPVITTTDWDKWRNTKNPLYDEGRNIIQEQGRLLDLIVLASSEATLTEINVWIFDNILHDRMPDAFIIAAECLINRGEELTLIRDWISQNVPQSMMTAVQDTLRTSEIQVHMNENSVFSSTSVDTQSSSSESEDSQTANLYKKLDKHFYIPGYSADVVEFPSTSSDDSSSSESEDSQTAILYKKLDQHFYIPGYSADVVEFPSTSSDDSSSNESERDNQIDSSFNVDTSTSLDIV